MEKISKLTLAEVRAAIFGPQMHLAPGTVVWNKQMESIIRNMKD